jgi:mycothiol system anti-sigma-R factor
VDEQHEIEPRPHEGHGGPDHRHGHDHPGGPPKGSDDDREDCVESLESLYVFLDGELTVERRTEIKGHLDDCVDCYGAYDFEAELRTVVSMSCREEVPQHLRDRVAEALRRLQQ